MEKIIEVILRVLWPWLIKVHSHTPGDRERRKQQEVLPVRSVNLQIHQHHRPNKH